MTFGWLSFGPVVLGLLLVQVPAAKTDRAQQLGDRLKCMCGCNQILTQCNHVGCTVSARMLQELADRVQRNEPDDLLLQSFVQEYGPEVILTPATHGFGLVAWVTPAAAVGAGLALVSVLLRRWRRRAAPVVADLDARWLARVRAESEEEE